MDEHDSTSFIRDLWRVFKFPWVRGDEIAYTFMGAFFGETEKPHKLISNLWWVYGLARDKPSREKFRDRKKTTYTQVVTVDAAGVTHRSITGGPDLKKNEEYTDAFGESFAELFLNYRADAGNCELSYDLDDYEQCPISFSAWQDLNLASCLAKLQFSVSVTP
jgi:hypothetical protein